VGRSDRQPLVEPPGDAREHDQSGGVPGDERGRAGGRGDRAEAAQFDSGHGAQGQREHPAFAVGRHEHEERSHG
jgi:hypothetical protein